MAIPTDDEICDAVQEAGAYGMTIGDLGKRLGVSWQSLTKRMKALCDQDEPSRRIYGRYWGGSYKMIYRHVGFFANGRGGSPLQWDHEKGGWVNATIEPTSFQKKLLTRAKRRKRTSNNSLEYGYYDRLHDMGLVRQVEETDKWTTWETV